MNLFAHYIKDTREERGLSLTETAELIGCTKSHLWDLEHGRSNNPTVRTLVGLSVALDLDIGRLTLVAAAALATPQAPAQTEGE